MNCFAWGGRGGLGWRHPSVLTGFGAKAGNREAASRGQDWLRIEAEGGLGERILLPWGQGPLEEARAGSSLSYGGKRWSSVWTFLVAYGWTFVVVIMAQTHSVVGLMAWDCESLWAKSLSKSSWVGVHSGFLPFCFVVVRYTWHKRYHFNHFKCVVLWH